MSATLANNSPAGSVEVRNGDLFVALTLTLGEKFTGGEIARVTANAPARLEGADELGRSYQLANWLSGIASGALYAFRALKVPRQVVHIEKLVGRLRASDMSILASASTQAIATLLQRQPPVLDWGGWQVSQSAATSTTQAAIAG
jgi:hypothetical protein